jgi:predicted Zn-dependent protease
VADAAEIARLAPTDDELLPRLGPQIYREVQAYDPSVDEITPMDRAGAVAEVIELCEAAGGNAGSAGFQPATNSLKAAGAFSDGSGSSAMATSGGLFAFHQSSNINFSMTALGDDSSGWASGSSHKRAGVDTRSLGETAVEKALKSREPREIPPGQYTVILEPAAVSVIAFMFTGFNALAVDEGRSFLSGRMGQKILGDNITLVSDPYHPLQQGRPFGGDGIPTKRVVLAENGVAANLVYDRLTARKHHVEPTGHGGSGRSTHGAYPSHIVMEGGGATVEDMIASTDRGVLITRFWYVRVVDPMKVIITGMTRDGTFWIEGGKIAYGIKNLRFNQSVLDMLNSVEMMSKPALAGGMVVPAIKVKEFNFTSGTEAV